MSMIGSSSSQYRSKEESCDFSYQAALDNFCAYSDLSGGECDLSRSGEWSKAAKDSVNQQLAPSFLSNNTNISSSTNYKNNSNNTNSHIVDQKVNIVSLPLFPQEKKRYSLDSSSSIDTNTYGADLIIVMDSAMSKLKEAVTNVDQFQAFSELEKLLKNEAAKRLLGNALSSRHKDLIKSAHENNWLILENILKCNTKASYFYAKDLRDGSGSKLRLESDGEKAIKEMNPSSDVHYPLFQKELFNSEGEFLNFVSENIAKIKVDRIKTIVLTYPLFVSEERLLECFNGFDGRHKKNILKIFNKLVRNGFIERTDSSENNALNEFHRKFKKTDKIVEKYQPSEKSKNKSKSTYGVSKKNISPLDGKIANNAGNSFSDCDANQLAGAFTARDAKLIAAIKFEDIRNWLQNGKAQPESVVQLEKACEATIQGIAFEIISKTDSVICMKLIKKFVAIRNILLENKNLHSASLIKQALNLPIVNDMWPYGLFWENPMPVEKEETLLPVDQGFWEGLRKVYDSCVITDTTKYALTFKNSTIASNQINIEKNAAYSCVSSLQSIPLESLTDLYYFFHKREFLQPYSKIEMAEWNSAYLASFLFDHENGNGAAMLKKLFGMGIYTGEQLLEAFSKDKDFIENWPVSMKIKMWGEYLSYLSPISLYEIQ